jgi:hypothetical protein
MFEHSFFYRPEIMTLVWVAIFISDWLMNYNGAKLYYRQARQFLVFEKGDNLRPISMDELNRPRLLIARFISELVITTLGIWLLLYNCKLYSSRDSYEFFCGFFILLEACVHFRHMGNVALFSSATKSSGIKGSVSIPRWIMLRAASVDYALFAVSFLLIYLVNKNSFVLGGCISCIIVSFIISIYAIFEKIEFFSIVKTAS